MPHSNDCTRLHTEVQIIVSGTKNHQLWTLCPMLFTKSVLVRVHGESGWPTVYWTTVVFPFYASFQVTKEAVLESWPTLRGENLSRKHWSSLQRLEREKGFQWGPWTCARARVCTWVRHDWAVIVSVWARATWKTFCWPICLSQLWWAHYIICSSGVSFAASAAWQ